MSLQKHSTDSSEVTLKGEPKKSLYFAVVTFVFALVLYIIGGMMFHSNYKAKFVYAPNSCEVIAHSYYRTECSFRGGKYVCFIPVWEVAYSIYEDTTEIRVNATIERNGFRAPEDAEKELNQYQIGRTYSCWYNTADPSQVTWNEPNTFVGMMLLIFGGVTTILCFVCVFLAYRACHVTKISKSDPHRYVQN